MSIRDIVGLVELISALVFVFVLVFVLVSVYAILRQKRAFSSQYQHSSEVKKNEALRSTSDKKNVLPGNHTF